MNAGGTPATLLDVLRERAADDRGHGYRFVRDHEPEPETLSYRELDRTARDIAAELTLFAPQGARALLLYPPGLDFVVAFFGALYAGVVPVPVYPPSGGADLSRALHRLEHVVVDASPEVVLTTGQLLAAKDALGLAIGPAELPWLATDQVVTGTGDGWTAPRVRADDVALLQYTSGSTAAPKGVVVRHRNLLANLAAIRDAMRLTADSVAVGWVPSYHDMGLVGFVLAAPHTGFSSYLLAPTDFLHRPAFWLETISRFTGADGTLSGGPNFGYDLCVRRVTEAERDRLDLSGWRLAFSGAEKVRPDVLRRFAERFGPCGFAPEGLYPCYGLAEASLFVTGARPGAGLRTTWLDRRRLARDRVDPVQPDTPDAVEVASCGGVAGGHRLVVVDPLTRQPVEPGRVGELWFAGPSMASGYWRRPAESDAVFRARLADGDGPFLRTGDLGFEHDGELYVTGRRTDLMVVHGRNIYPTEVEEVAQSVDQRLRPGCGASFLATGDSSDLVLVQEATETEPDALRKLALDVRAAVLERLDVTVADVVFVAPRALEKTSSGKLRRRACRQDYLDGLLTSVFQLRTASAGTPVRG